jgi:hypothetical protein
MSHHSITVRYFSLTTTAARRLYQGKTHMCHFSSWGDADMVSLHVSRVVSYSPFQNFQKQRIQFLLRVIQARITFFCWSAWCLWLIDKDLCTVEWGWNLGIYARGRWRTWRRRAPTRSIKESFLVGGKKGETDDDLQVGIGRTLFWSCARLIWGLWCNPPKHCMCPSNDQFVFHLMDSLRKGFKRFVLLQLDRPR